MAKYQLYDDFNERIISRHNSATAAGRAARKLLAAITRRNGPNSYLPVALLRRDEDGVFQVVGSEDPDGEDFYLAESPPGQGYY
jgi:hypothetical protein